MPCPITDDNPHVLSSDVIAHIQNTTHFVVERARTTRRFLSAINHPKPIDTLTIFELNKKNPEEGLYDFLKCLDKGIDVGMFSEAGCPGIADPGHLVVSYAHLHDIPVVPLVGPSSILLALIASGMNGQNFAFNGYLPNKGPELTKKLRSLEGLVSKTGQTQIFMDAPYRNGFLFEHCMKSLSPNLRLCIACDISGNNEFIKTKKIKEWKGYDAKQLHKRPAIFLIGK